MENSKAVMPAIQNEISTIQVLVDSGLQKRPAWEVIKVAHHGTHRYDVFQYSRKRGQNWGLKSVGREEPAGGTTVRVFQFFEPAQHSRIQKRIKSPSVQGQHIIIVASPKVFNQPRFRPTLDADDVSVLVEEPGKFEVEHLEPWIEKIAQSMATHNPASKRSTVDPSVGDSLEISKHLRDPDSGRLDGQKIAALLGISITDLATKVCGVTKQALSQSPTSGGIQEKLQPLEDVSMGLLWCGGDGAKFRAWLNRPNGDFPSLKGKSPSPLDLILSGHAALVASKIHQLRTGHPA
jgi:hypothetical protein